MRRIVLLLGAVLAGPTVHADSPASLLEVYRSTAAAQSPSSRGPSASAGAAFFRARGRKWSCASCHTPDPLRTGRHAATGKPIRPLAPAANPERFRSRDKAEKWFKRNCNDTLGRECTAAEKADVLAYLMSLGGRGAPQGNSR